MKIVVARRDLPTGSTVTVDCELGARILDNSSAGPQGTKANGRPRKSNFDQVVINGPDELREDLNNPKVTRFSTP